MVIYAIVALLAGAAIAAFLLRPRAAPTDVPQTRAAPSAANLDAAVQAFLATQPPALTARRPVVTITLEPMAVDDIRASKVGGKPYWTAGRAYPSGSDRRPLFLLAQIDLGAMPQPLKGYPRSGLLQFFIGETDFYGANFESDMSFEQLQEQRNFRVVYWPRTDAEPVEIAARDSERLPFTPTRPRRMRFDVGIESLSSSDYRFDAAFGQGGMASACEAHAATLGIDPDTFGEAVWDARSGSGHKIGGYPYFTQEDPRSNGPYELLFQLDSDDEMMWGDAGVAGFFIDPAALAQADFSRVAYSWDCS